MSSSKIACLIALLPLFLPMWGFNVFLAWVALCVAAILADRLLLWAALCVGPLALLSIDYLYPPAENAALYQLRNISLFVVIALVTAGTGVFSVLRSILTIKPDLSGVSTPALEVRRYTLWQRLWWKPLPDQN